MNVITHCILTKRAGKRKVKLSVEKTQHLCNSLQINEVGKTQHLGREIPTSGQKNPTSLQGSLLLVSLCCTVENSQLLADIGQEIPTAL